MKTINLSIIIASLFFSFGCDDKENPGVYGPITPEIDIEYVDKEGNPIMNESDIKQLYESGERLEVLSITDDKGVSIMDYEKMYGLRFYIFEKFSRKSDMDRYYTVQYKVPQSWRDSIEVGESVEELKLTFHLNGFNSKFTKALYNDKEISRYVTPELIDPDIHTPHSENMEAIERRKKKLLYNGDFVAYIYNYTIHLILPVERTK